MSTRTTLRPHPVLAGADMSQTSFTSDVTVLNSISGWSYEVSWTGTTPIGTLNVQVSNDYSLNPAGTVNNAGTWVSLYLNVNGTPTKDIAISGDTGSAFLDVIKCQGFATRLLYTKVSGVGSMSATINGKVS